MQREFDTPEPVELTVELGGGSIVVEATETGTTTVQVDGPRADDFAVEQRGDRIAVIAPRHKGIFSGRDDHDVRVSVPTDSGLYTRTGSAELRAEGTYSKLRAKTGSGDLEIDTVTGTVVVDAGSGSITCDAVGDLRIRTGSGSIEIGTVTGRGAVSTGSGDVTLGRTGDVVAIKTGSGDTTVGLSSADFSATAGSGGIRVDRADSGRIRGRTGSGDIAVGVPGGTPVWTDVSSNSGRVRSDLAPVGKPADGQNHVELRLQTGSGDIVLHQV